VHGLYCVSPGSAFQVFSDRVRIMEKQEARIKCTGCGSSYKLKIPVTDKPVNFKCKKCGKILKVRVATAAKEQPEAEPDAAMPGFETTQLPDSGDFFDPDSVGGPSPAVSGAEPEGELFGGGFQLDPTLPLFGNDPVASEGPRIKPTLDETIRIPEPVFEQGYADQLFPQAKATKQPSAQEPQRTRGSERRWLALDDEQVKGPFTDNEVVSMIQEGEIDAETPLRMGQRPWIKAAQVADFKHCFSKGKPIRADAKRIDVRPGREPVAEPAEPEITETPFYQELGALAPYPLGRGKWQPIAIFFGAAFVLCAALSFDFLIGLPVSIAGWIVLYGYLTTVMNTTKSTPAAPPPAWDFSRVKEMALGGVPVFLVLLIFSLVPVSVCLLIMIACFLNGMDLFGYLFIALTVLVFVASLFIAPAALVIQDESQSLATTLNPAKILKLILKGSTAYKMLAATSVAVGAASMLVVVLAVFLVDIPMAGFVVAGLLMALVLSYGNFIWFHVLGRFSRENRGLMVRVLHAAKA
jgi:hypothetical protein